LLAGAYEVIECVVECPLLAPSGHFFLHRICPLSGLEQT
jgi:hypothetical protein